MIQYLEVSGLPRQQGPIKLTFNDDLNIITGRNGSGKTTILRLIWYIISGNIEIALREIPFNRVHLITDRYNIIIIRQSLIQCRIEITFDGRREVFDDNASREDGEIDAEDAGNEVVKGIGSSIFFPTFRRIEGGFTLGQSSQSTIFSLNPRPKNNIEQALLSLSSRLTVEKHIFIASISTVDIVTLLMKNYTEMSELSNTMQMSMSQNVIDQIKDYKGDSNIHILPADLRAEEVLDRVRAVVEAMEGRRESIMAPLNAVRSVVDGMFQHGGIKLGSRLSFGDAATAVNSDMLSAGEKQMLSFICYNAFYKDTVIFIDEPELSLHVDWQRRLFPTLIDQGSNNQFIIATHSPFIYSKYPEKEIVLNRDRGDSQFEVD